MVRIFANYYDTHGNKYKVISFNGNKYSCQSLKTGKIVFLSGNELSPKPPVKPEKIKFTNAIKKKDPVKEIVNETSEPVYEEPVYEEPVYETDSGVSLNEDNTEETADDFYADL